MSKLGVELGKEVADARREVSDKIAGLQRTMINLMVLLTAIFSAVHDHPRHRGLTTSKAGCHTSRG